MRPALCWRHQKELDTMEGSRVCFIGHRKIPMTDELKVNIQTAIENLIVNDKATYFLFGSRSQFDDLCHGIVSELQQKYPSIVRVAYTCRSEAATMKESLYLTLSEDSIYRLFPVRKPQKKRLFCRLTTFKKDMACRRSIFVLQY